jgi:hypothetical protein
MFFGYHRFQHSAGFSDNITGILELFPPRSELARQSVAEERTASEGISRAIQVTHTIALRD